MGYGAEKALIIRVVRRRWWGGSHRWGGTNRICLGLRRLTFVVGDDPLPGLARRLGLWWLALSVHQLSLGEDLRQPHPVRAPALQSGGEGVIVLAHPQPQRRASPGWV